ncbi:MAG: serine hydrolase [Bacteroidota bacterium]|nr:serine hydrolase [Bacteroidota bacterium]
MKKIIITVTVCLSFFAARAQQFFDQTRAAQHWVDSVFRKLSKREKIAQLMIIRAHSNLGPEHVQQVKELISKYNIGGLCFFQGGPVRQALLTNDYQQMAKTPLMICIDGEWGLGMRLDSVISFPRQLTLGAMQDAQLVYRFGKAVGEQCRRMGIQVNYAPVVDINNNPNNPVINDRSFGEDKYKVALYGTAYMKGLQDMNVMACAKHFPGHGDVSVDSHKDLPVITKTRAQLDSLELYPFRELIKAGVGSIMNAHLYIPAIDSTVNQATSLSKKTVTGLLHEELGFKGLTFTDALEMQGVAKFYPKGEASLQSLIAGNDMLCLPGDVPGSIEKVIKAMRKGILKKKDLYARVKKVLLAKYNLGLNHFEPIDTAHLVADLNQHTQQINTSIAENAITLLQQNNTSLVPLQKEQRIAYVAIGAPKENAIAAALRKNYRADVYLFAAKAAIGNQVMDDLNKVIPIDKTDSNAAAQLLQTLEQKKYDVIIVGLHNYSRRPANNFGLSNPSVYLLDALAGKENVITLFFGNPYAIKNVTAPQNLLAFYEDDDITQSTAVAWLLGKVQAKGKLPVTVNDRYRFGEGLVYNRYFPFVQPATVGVNENSLAAIDSIANDAIEKGAFPGCVVLAAKDGKVVYNKAFGYTSTDKKQKVTTATVYDLASVTKISATTVSVMKLYEEGKIELDKTLGDYLPWTKGSDKAALKIKDVLLHQAGLTPFIPFYKEVIDATTGVPNWNVFSAQRDAQHLFRVAEGLYVRNDWQDTLKERILQSKLSQQGHYVYSDNDFIFLGKIVEALSGKPLDEYARENFYGPLHMVSTTFRPRERMPLEMIAPTEDEKRFRRQLLWGDVHDEGAAMFSEVAGHAGLFSNAYDLSQLYQMLLNGGELNGKRFLKKETVEMFTAYNSDVSRRGLGFDKPEKDNASRKEPYPSLSASPQTFGHTGFTGTCVWVDPKYNLVYIFLSNRVNPTRENNKLGQLNVRPKIQEAIYNAIRQY